MKHLSRQILALSRLSVLDLYRRKDLAVVFVLSGVILTPLFFFTPFGMSAASRYTNELAMLLVWLFSAVIGLGVASRLFPPEFNSRTIYPLLSKPVSRGTVLVGKYLGALAASLSALVLFYAAYGVLAGTRQGVWFPPVLWQALLLHAGFMVVITALSLLGSLALTVSANLTLCGLVTAGMLVFGQRLVSMAADQPAPGRWALYAIHWIAPHLEFFDMRQRLVHEWPTISWGVCGAVWLYALCYAAACLALAAVIFRRKKF
jgi:Cu-processing system permease protein